MTPIPIPDHCVPEGAKRIVISPPDGDMTNDKIRPVEAIAALIEGEGPQITMLVALDPGDLERLAGMEQPAVWLSMLTGQIPPFSVEVADGEG